MLSVADKIKNVQWPETKKQMAAISEAREVFKGLNRKAFFLTSKNTDGGNPAQILMDYIRMLTHIDILVYNGL